MNIGFIGAGNLAEAIIVGLKSDGSFTDDILIYDTSEQRSEFFSSLGGLILCASAEQVVLASDILLLAVKPHQLTQVLDELREVVAIRSPLIVSLAVGKTIDFLEQALSDKTAIARVMVNLNARYRLSTGAYVLNNAVTEEQKQLICSVFSRIGTLQEIPESQFSVFFAVAGSSPAFAYLYVDALAKAAEKAGMASSDALMMAAQTVFGSAKTLLESHIPPCEMVERVCSPGGTTIEGIKSLRESNFSETVIKAIEAVLAKDAFLQGR